MGNERFSAPRGTPSAIWPDNGTNFVVVEKKILNCIQPWNAQAPAGFYEKWYKIKI